MKINLEKKIDAGIWTCTLSIRSPTLQPLRYEDYIESGLGFYCLSNAGFARWDKRIDKVSDQYTYGQTLVVRCALLLFEHFILILFASCFNKCCDMLDSMGVPYIKGKGEAEKMCAALNQAGIVDACISDDGDCFLYGAKVVYKNFTLDYKVILDN